ncbi:MAG: hypothetical protein IT518_03095 [Burkholderiales bacterium]|nr:hypothetical protein [Burkholderiales bacterium]
MNVGLVMVVVLLSSPAFAGDGERRLTFGWAEPTASVRCDLTDDLHPDRSAPRFAGYVEKQEAGVACLVQIPRKRFDAHYRFCTVASIESLPREHYACFVVYSAGNVTFHFSYSSDAFGAPPCAFVCTPK